MEERKVRAKEVEECFMHFRKCVVMFLSLVAFWLSDVVLVKTFIWCLVWYSRTFILVGGFIVDIHFVPNEKMGKK